MSATDSEPARRDRRVALLELVVDIALLANRLGDRDPVLQSSLELLCRRGGWSVGHVYWVRRDDERGLLAEPSSLWHVERPTAALQAFARATEEEPYVFTVGEGLPGRVLAWGTSAWVGELRDDPGFLRKEHALEAGLRCGLALPLSQLGSEVAGIVELYSTEPHLVDEELERLMIRPAGVLLGRVIERSRARAAAARADKILEVARHGYVAMNADGCVLTWNPAAEAIFGWSESEARGRPVAELIIPEHLREAHREGLARLLETGKAKVLDRVLEMPALRRDGTEFPVELTISKVEAEGELHFHAFLQDISARRQSEEELRQRERQLAQAHAIARLGAWRWDVAGDRVTWSEELYRIYALPAEDFEPTYEGFLERVHPDDRDAVEATVRRAFETVSSFEIRHRIVRPDGEVRVLMGRGEVECDDGGRVIAMTGTGQDVTEQAEAELRARQLAISAARAAHLARANEELQEFVHAASHDLQEPLRTIHGYLELLQRRYGESLGGDAAEFIDFTLQATRRMQALIEGLLSLSRVTTTAKSKEEVALKDVLDDALANLAASLEEAKATVSVRIPRVSVDRLQVMQLFQNLVSNALRFRGEAPARVEILCRESEDGLAWTLGVRDHGLGFEPRHERRIFRIFHRVHGAEYGGTGIGLALCRKIVQRHGGQIWAESKPGEGATFWFTLPRRPAEQAEAEPAELDR